MKWICPDCGFGPVEIKPDEFPVHCICKSKQLTPEEMRRDFEDRILGGLPEDSRRLLGDRIKDLTDALGIPTCGGCEERRRWLNKADAWIRARLRTE